MYLPRRLESSVLRLTEMFPVVMVTGPRQAGKTSLLEHLREPNRRSVSLDDLDLRSMAQDDPKLFIESFPPPVLIDEFQYAPDLLSYIKIKVDELTTRGKNAEAAGMYWLTGSQHFVLMKNVRESLAGRVAILELLGMDPTESEGKGAEGSSESFFERDPQTLETWSDDTSPQGIFQRIISGSMPALQVIEPDEDVRRRFYSSYVQTYLERDVAGLDGVRNLRSFELFFRLLAARAGQLVNYSELAKEVGVSAITIRDWITILERSFHIVTVSPFYRSFSKRLVKTPKIYFLDSGLHAWLTGWQEPETTFRGPMAGQIFENWVMGLLIRSYVHRGRRHDLYFWRTSTGQEIDVWHVDGSRFSTAEIKVASGGNLHSMVKRQFAPLSTIDPSPYTWGRRFLLSLGDQVLPLGSDTWQVPVRFID